MAEVNTDLFAQRLSERDFRRVSQLVETTAGIHLPEHKRSMVELRTARRARAAGIRHLSEYCAFVFKEGAEAERRRLVDALTTNKTEFFREDDHFHQLVEVVIPEIMQNRQQRAEEGPLRVWSAGCSTGEEPYTLSMVLRRYGWAHKGFDYSVLGSDICGKALEKAVAAVYPESCIGFVPAEYRRSSFLRNKDHSLHLVRVAPEVRERVSFVRHNLLSPERPLHGPFDVIFCRNVIIYFERENQIKVLDNLARALVPGGFLFVGHSEALHGMPLPLDHVGPTLYRRTS